MEAPEVKAKSTHFAWQTMKRAIYVECISKAFHLCLLQKIEENITVSHSDGIFKESELLCQPWTEEGVKIILTRWKYKVSEVFTAKLNSGRSSTYNVLL